MSERRVGVAKHGASRDSDEGRNWWYLAKPPMGAIAGLAVYAFPEGLGSFLGIAPPTSGLGVAAVALVAGGAAERVTGKIEEVSKTPFAVSDPTPALTILEPGSGQHVARGALRVVVSAVALWSTCARAAAHVRRYLPSSRRWATRRSG